MRIWQKALLVLMVVAVLVVAGAAYSLWGGESVSSGSPKVETKPVPAHSE
jgi:hypothetical protein